MGNLKTNKAATLYQGDSAPVSLSSNPDGSAIASGHLDGAICRFYFNDEVSGAAQGKFCTHTCVPTNLVWAEDLIVIGNDNIICMYSKEGKPLQKLLPSKEAPNFDVSCVCTNSTGNSVIIGGFNGLRILNYKNAQKKWEEAPMKPLENMYTITTFGWKPDGSRLIIVCYYLLT